MRQWLINFKGYFGIFPNKKCVQIMSIAKTKMDERWKIRNESKTKNLEMAQIEDKIRENHLR